jgi:endonuclease/exonuclease/phosphatase (EEP) superfamily protein YafD
MAQQQMDFQERMRKTQYQTTVADLKAAGLNPMLAYTQGGAGTPQGATAQMGNPLGEAGNSAKEAGMAMAQYQQLQTQNKLTDNQAIQSEATANLLDQQAITEMDKQAQIRAETQRERAKMPGYGKFGAQQDATINQLNSSARQARANSAYTEATQPEAVAIGNTYRDNPNLKTSEAYIRQASGVVSTAAEAADMFKPKPIPRTRPR